MLIYIAGASLKPEPTSTFGKSCTSNNRNKLTYNDVNFYHKLLNVLPCRL